jgi:hypothetical protein
LIYRAASFQRPSLQVINVVSDEAIGSAAFRALAVTAPVSSTWVANLAVFVPFGVCQPFTVTEVWWYNGATAGGNIDIGLYDTAGNRLASLGSTAQGTAANVVTSTTFTDYTLAPGDYYMAFAASATTGAIFAWAPTANIAAGFGIGQMATALALPNPATIVPLTNALIPDFGLNGYSVTV